MKKRTKTFEPPQYDCGQTFNIAAPSWDEIRIGLLSDLHCGHYLGLTPPDFFRPVEAEDPAIALLARKQREYWDTYNHLVRMAGPVDHLLVNGDTVDGNGFRLDGAEMICETHDQMSEMAARCIKQWVTPGRTRTIHMIGGTPSHTWFGPIDCDKLVKDHVITKCPNVTYDQSAVVEFTFPGTDRTFAIYLRHDTPKGGIQTGGAGPGALRQSIRLDLETIYNQGQEEKLPDLYVYSHAHEACYLTQPLKGRNRHVIVTPCLQGSGSVYGKTKCAGLISWGITVLTLKVSKDDIQFSHKFLTRTLAANRQTRHVLAYEAAKA